jgi:uncharacterized protein (TIGR03546 family)
MILKLIAKVLAALNSNARPFQIGAGVAFGLLLALLPATNLIFLAVLLIVFLIRVHQGITIVTGLAFSLVVPPFDGLLNDLGYWFLTLPALRGFFEGAYTLPVVPLTRFNNTLVAGGLVSGLALWLPVALISVVLVNLYRKHIHARIANSKIVQAIKAAPWARKIAEAMQSARHVWPTTG